MPKQCAQDVNSCPGNEICENGQCGCMKSLQRNDRGFCVHEMEIHQRWRAVNPTTAPSTVVPVKQKLTVRIDGPAEVQLPINGVTLSAEIVGQGKPRAN